ncbi:PA14 domain protein [Chthoniobacter flavus Ellin428]|uniref:PA14 domain protein n=1 Tax=Chthoniobacter flavus Ellin428 TaxID=497964 RepID=B4CVL6_9BACT|nr:PA14 domain-containing protein [Chthoniobacter flavus]EDY21458.1 PA14 domain protein [Chthoniobacter flavus Ellin428]TCO95413.1 PA14 domain-containing protein [Chthoniobacter flavus]
MFPNLFFRRRPVAHLLSGASVALFLGLAGVSRAGVDPGEYLISEMNCAACHDAGPVKQRLASRPSPRLDAAHGVKVTPQWLHAFLLNPQAETPGTLMPDMLAAMEEPKRAEMAEALTHYLVSLRGAQKATPIGQSAAAINVGRTLYHTVGCVQCHAPQELPPSKADPKNEFPGMARTSIPLGDLAKKFTVAELADFLRDPLKSRPGGRMPSLKLNPTEARAVAMYLLRSQAPEGEEAHLSGLSYEYYEEQLPELPEFDRLTPKTTGNVDTFTLAVAQRKNDFAIRFRGVIAIPTDGEYQFYTKSDDGSRLFIDDKQVVENGGIHPDQERNGKIKLTAGSHSVRVIYFDGGGQTALKVSWKGPGINKTEIPSKVLSHEGKAMLPVGNLEFTVDDTKAAAGANYYISLQCARCHGDLPSKWPITATAPVARPLARLNGRQPAGCLSPKVKPGLPRFEISDRQRVVILGQLGAQAALTAELTPEQQIIRTMTVMNCFACHNRDHRGGPEGLHREYFANVGEVDLGDEGKMPPQLNGVGAKLRPEWIKAVLTEGGAVRPYMATRMPQFGAANVGQLPDLFSKADSRADATPDPDVAASGVANEANKYGRKLIGVGGLTCIACHMFDGHKSLGVPALDLATAGQRLKFDWFRRYLLDPQSLRPGTRMPAFWPNGVATNKDVLGGDSEKQISAIWAYLARKNFTDLPTGLVQGKMELVADKEAIIYRNFIEGGGSRAIGVGYPEKANLAFDANDMRLAMIWQGAFIDAARHRTGRGQGFEKPLGTNVVHEPPGPPFAILNSESAVWPKDTGQAAGWQFRGYLLDAKRRPTFRYSWNDLSIEDYPVAVSGDPDAGFHRTVTVHAEKPVEHLFFRAAVGKKIKETDGTFAVDETLKLKFPGSKPIIRDSDNESELLVPLTFQGGEAKFVEEMTW